MFVNLTCINQHLSITSTTVLTGVTVFVILVRDQHVETF